MRLRTTKQLRAIGFWATWWWALFCFYGLLLVWLAQDHYVELTKQATSGFWSDWWLAVRQAYQADVLLQVFFGVILLGWIIGGAIWLKALKRAKISYRMAFKDLFLTLRR